jgi:sporulation protein YlmC with PRC-barrel domain
MKTSNMALSLMLVLSLILAAPVLAAQEQHAGKASGDQAAFHSFKASDLMDKNVNSQNGEKLGKVEDVVISHDGRVNFVVVSSADGDKFIPVPWRAFQTAQFSSAGAKDKDLIANMDKNKFMSAPSFDKNNWPNLTSSEWENRVYGYYGMTAPSDTGMRDMHQGKGTMERGQTGTMDAR